MAPTRSNKLSVLARRPSNYTRPNVVSEKVARDITTYSRPRTVSRDHRVNRSSRLQRGSNASARTSLKIRRLITPIRSHTQPRPQPTRLVSVSESPNEVTLPSTQKVKLPAKLPRINIGNPISLENVRAVAPELEDVSSVQYLQDTYQKLGPEMMKGCKEVSLPNLDPTEIPTMSTIKLTLNGTRSIPPTHVFAISRTLDASSNGSSFPKDGLTLHPVHSVIPTIHCSSLPRLPFSNVSSPSVPGEKVSVPFIRLQLPFPEEFSTLLEYLYTRNALKLMARYVPNIGRDATKTATTCGSRQGQIDAYAREVTKSNGWAAILKKIMALNGFVKNVCTLGVSDRKMWAILDLSWEILLAALKISVEATNRQH